MRSDGSPAPLRSASLQARSRCRHSQDTVPQGQSSSTASGISKQEAQEPQHLSLPSTGSSSRFGFLPCCEELPAAGEGSAPRYRQALVIAHEPVITGGAEPSQAPVGLESP